MVDFIRVSGAEDAPVPGFTVIYAIIRYLTNPGGLRFLAHAFFIDSTAFAHVPDQWFPKEEYAVYIVNSTP